MLTSFGRFCRKLRIEESENLREMAGKLQITPSYLSLVENGKRRLPAKWGRLLMDNYALETQQKKELSKIMLVESLAEREKHALYEVLTVLQNNIDIEHSGRLRKAAASLLGKEIIESKHFVVEDWLSLLDYLKT